VSGVVDNVQFRRQVVGQAEQDFQLIADHPG
jgi:hypothetical protein